MSESAPSTAQTPPSASVWDLLSSLATLQALFRVGDGEDSELGECRVLGVHPEHDAIVISEPSQPQRLPKLRLETFVEGRQLVFGCDLDERVESLQQPGWRCLHPQLLVDQQRRSSFRVHIPSNYPLRAWIRDHQGDPLPANVLDLSRVGFGARIATPLVISDGVSVQCTLELPDFDIEAQATIRHHCARGNSTHIGLEFESLTPTLETALSRIVFKLQRQLLRERKPT